MISMLGNLSRSLMPLYKLISGFGYVLGLLFVISGLLKFKKIAEAKQGSSSEEKPMVALTFFIGGVLLIFLPTILPILSNTVFGNENILQYIPYNPNNIYSSMGVLLKTAGLLWFVRGCSLVVHSSQPGAKEGKKGLFFLFAGILAMNFSSTYGILSYIMNQLISMTKLKPP